LGEALRKRYEVTLGCAPGAAPVDICELIGTHLTPVYFKIDGSKLSPELGRLGSFALVGTVRCCSPRHRMPFNNNEGFTIRWMTRRETLLAKSYGVVTTYERGFKMPWMTLMAGNGPT
jgi:hypothetical protein